MPHTKFQLNPTSGSGEEVENAKSLTDAGRTDAGRTRTQDDGQRDDDISSPGPKGPGELIREDRNDRNRILLCSKSV